MAWRLTPFEIGDLSRIAAFLRTIQESDPRVDGPEDDAFAAFVALESNRGGRDFVIGERDGEIEAVLLSGRYAVADRSREIRGFRIFIARGVTDTGWAGRLLDTVAEQDEPGEVIRRTVVAEDWPRAQERLRARGYVEVREVLYMRRFGLPPARPVVPAGFALRDAALSVDGEALTELYNTAHAKTFGFSPLAVDDLTLGLEAPGGRLLVLEASDGALAGAVQTLPYLAGVGVLHAVQVAPGHQGQGLGKILVAAALNALAQQGFGTVELSVDAANGPALRLYHSLGFAEHTRDLVYEHAT